ncbi:MAG: hypothetical protein ABIO70_34770 [Pseudomonadota bacterium]
MWRVLDGDTLVFRPDWADPANAHVHYPRQFVVRLRHGDAPEHGEPGYGKAKLDLSEAALGQHVEIEVAYYEREWNRDVAEVFLIGPSGHRGREVKVSINRPRGEPKPVDGGPAMGVAVALVITGFFGGLVWLMDRA